MRRLDLIYDRRREGFDPADAFHFVVPDTVDGSAITKRPRDDENLPIEEKLKKHIIDGEKRNLIEHLEERARHTHPGHRQQHPVGKG